MLSDCLGPHSYRPRASSHFPLPNPPGLISICLCPGAPMCPEQENSSNLGDQSGRSPRGLATYLVSRFKCNAKFRTHCPKFGIEWEHLSGTWNTDLHSSCRLSLSTSVLLYTTAAHIIGHFGSRLSRLTALCSNSSSDSTICVRWKLDNSESFLGANIYWGVTSVLCQTL